MDDQTILKEGLETYSTHIDLALRKVESAVAGMRGSHTKRAMGDMASLLYVYLHPLRARVDELLSFSDRYSG